MVDDCGAVRKICGILWQRVGEMRMITASFTRVLQRCAGHLCMHFLAIFQELSRVSKTCNQLNHTSGRWLARKHSKNSAFEFFDRTPD